MLPRLWPEALLYPLELGTESGCGNLRPHSWAVSKK